MARQRATKTSGTDGTDGTWPGNDPSLFAPGGAFGSFSGAVALAGPNGAVLGANDAAGPIVELLRDGGHDGLRAAVDTALAGTASQINPLLVAPKGARGANGAEANGAEGAGLAFDLAALPWPGGGQALLLGRDITLERSLRAALIESRQRYKDLVEAVSDFAWETDAEGCFTFVSAEGALNYAAAQLIGARAEDLLIDHVEGQESPFTTKGAIQEIEIWALNAEGEPDCLLVTSVPLTGPGGEWRGARGLCRRITDERSHEVRLAGDRHRERLLAYILNIVREGTDPSAMLHAAASALVPALPASGVGIYRQAPDGALICVAESGDQPPDYLVDSLLQQVGGDEDEAEVRAEEGALYAKATRCHGERNGVLWVWRGGKSGRWTKEDRFLLSEIAGQIGLANRQLDREEELEELSSKDPLTGMLNRRSFEAAVERRYGQAGDPARGAALFYLDLDNFKLVNDRHGHQQGDLALVTLSRILHAQIRSRDLAARLGGDEFAFFMENVNPMEVEHKAIELLLNADDLKPYSGDAEHPLGLSIGVAVCDTARRESLEDLMKRADEAMYVVKRRGKGGYEVSLPASQGAGS